MENFKLTSEELIILDECFETKEEVIIQMAKSISNQGIVESYEEFLSALLKREEDSPTSVGYDFGLPHGKSKTVKRPAIAFARLKNEVTWCIEDGEEEKIKYVFMIAIPEAQAGDAHISILVNLSKKILDDEFREKLISVNEKMLAVELINS